MKKRRLHLLVLELTTWRRDAALDQCLGYRVPMIHGGDDLWPAENLIPKTLINCTVTQVLHRFANDK